MKNSLPPIDPQAAIQRARWMALVAAIVVLAATLFLGLLVFALLVGFVAGLLSLAFQLYAMRSRKPLFGQLSTVVLISGVVVPFASRFWVMAEALSVAALTLSLGILFFGRFTIKATTHG